MTWTPLRFAADLDPPKSRMPNLAANALVSFLPMQDVGTGSALAPSETRELEDVYDGYTYMQDGDVAIATISPSFQNGKGGVVQGAVNGVCFATTELTPLRPRAGTDARYLRYALQSESFLQTGTASLYGVAGQKRVPTQLLRDFKIWLPSLGHQGRIADFLDRETQRVDAVLHEVGALQELLSERQAAAIDSRVLPKRGDRDPWPTYRLKHLAAVPISTGVGLPAEHEDESWPRYIRTTDISGPTSLREDVFFSQPPELLQSAGVEYGDLLMTAAGSVGQSYLHLSHNPAVYAGYLARFRPKKDVESRFVAYWAQSSHYWMQIEQGAVRSTIDNFSAGRYRNMALALPSVQDQVRIADELDDLAELNSRARSLLSSLGNLLVERRRSLITAAVTGQLDVQAVA